MFKLTDGYLKKIFECKSLADASAQKIEGCLEDVSDKSLIRLYEKYLPVFKLKEVFPADSTLIKMITTDSVNEAFSWIDTDTFHEPLDNLDNGTVIIVNSFSLMKTSLAQQIYGGKEEDFVYKSEFSINDINTCFFIRDFQVVGRELNPTICRKIMPAEEICADENISATHTINSLMPCLKRTIWSVKALVTKRTELKNFTSKNGNSCCYTRFQLSDNTGTIELVAFNHHAKIKMIQEVETNNVYLVQYGDIKKLRSNCSAWNSEHSSEYEIVVTSDTQFTSLDEDSKRFLPSKDDKSIKLIEKNSVIKDTIERPSYNTHGYFDYFTPLDHLRFLKLGALVNVFGIITHIDSDLRFIERTNGKPLAVMNFEISDSSNDKIIVAMWGLEAEHHGLQVNRVVELMKVKLTNFKELSLSKLIISSIKDITAMDHENVKVLLRKNSRSDLKRNHSIDFNSSKKLKE